jgi:Electron transfer DM13
MRTSRSWSPSSLVAGISRLEIVVGAVVVTVLVALVLVESDVLAAPFENGRTVAFTLGGTLLAAAALVVMLHAGVRPIVRVLALGVPFVAVTWWLVSPFFIDQHVDEEFAVSIADASPPTTMPTTSMPTTAVPTTAVPTTAVPTTTVPPGPTLRGSGRFVGLAGHSGSGTAGVFALGDGTSVLRLEAIDIQNGPDLHLYVVPGAGATNPGEGSIYLGELRGNVGDLTYDLAPDAPLAPGPWTVLVWCDAFDVEFVGADVVVT